jgi:hypothetical protein
MGLTTKALCSLPTPTSVLQAAGIRKSGSKQTNRNESEGSNALQMLCLLTFTDRKLGSWRVQQWAGMSRPEGDASQAYNVSLVGCILFVLNQKRSNHYAMQRWHGHACEHVRRPGKNVQRDDASKGFLGSLAALKAESAGRTAKRATAKATLCKHLFQMYEK